MSADYEADLQEVTKIDSKGRTVDDRPMEGEGYAYAERGQGGEGKGKETVVVKWVFLYSVVNVCSCKIIDYIGMSVRV